jgi:hypothetical protein
MHAWMSYSQQCTKDGLGSIRGQFQTAGLTWKNKVNPQQNRQD